MDSLRKLQLTELRILKKVTEFCDEKGIPYVIMGGTLLGAIRHGGFIPWDDDVDIAIPREFYEKFLESGREKFDGTDGLKLRNFKLDENYKYYFSRVTDDSVKLIDRSAIKEKEQSAWIDIFPLDGMPSKKFALKIHKFRLLRARLLFQYSQFDTIVSVNLKGRPWHERLLIGIGKIIPVQKIFSVDKALKRLDKCLNKYKYAESVYAVNFMGAGKFKEMHERKIYDERDIYKFEDMSVYGVKNYDAWLTKMYGDYMTPPPENDRNKHFTEVIEEDKKYGTNE